MIRLKPAPREWLIYNASNGQFWGPDRGGYFGLWGAGLYTEKEARQLASNKDRLDRVHHISEYKDQIANMRGAFERLSAVLESSGAAAHAPAPGFVDVYRGRPLEQLTREELLVAAAWAWREIETLRRALGCDRAMEQAFAEAEGKLRT